MAVTRVVHAVRGTNLSPLFGASRRQLASTAVILCGSVVLGWGWIILSGPRAPPRVPVPIVEGLLVRIERAGSWNDWIEIDGDGAVRYRVRKGFLETVCGEGHVSGPQLEEISQSFAISDFCSGPRDPFMASPARSSDWIITYFGCSPPRTVRSNQLPVRAWWWDEQPRLPWSVLEITGVTQYWLNGDRR